VVLRRGLQLRRRPAWRATRDSWVPLRKPAEIREHLVKSGAVRETDLHRPFGVTEDELRAVHAPELIARLHDPSAVAMAIEVAEAAFLPRGGLASITRRRRNIRGSACRCLRRVGDQCLGRLPPCSSRSLARVLPRERRRAGDHPLAPSRR